MLKWILKWISSTDQRINRIQYLIIVIICAIGFILADIIWWYLWNIKDPVFSHYVYFIKIPFIWLSLIWAVNRFHDMNKTWWFILLFSIPIVNIWILIWLLVWKWSTWVNIYSKEKEKT